MEILLLLLALGAVGLPLIAFIQLGRQAARLRMLESQVSSLQKGMASPPPPGVAPAPDALTTPSPRMAPTLAATTALPPSPLPRQTPPPVPPPSRTKEEWEALIGGKFLNRIGALALIIGVGLFLKHAFDQHWINETTRVLIGVATGGGLLFGAARTQKHGLAIFAQGLVGAGLAILYLSVYASFNFYHLIPQIAAFGLMTAVTAIAFANAFRYDSLAVALMAWLGGFLTPFLLSTGESNELGLFTYIALLDAGILIISLRKTAWTILEPLALAGTWVIYLFWFSSDYGPDKLSLTLYFVAVFWGIFHVLSTGKAGTPSYVALRHVTAAANALFTTMALYSLIEPEHHDWMGGTIAVLALLYAATARLIAKRNAPLWISQLSVTAAVLLITATAVQFRDFITVSIWSVEALALAWLGSRRLQSSFSWLAFSLFILAGLKLIASDIELRSPGEIMILFNRRGLTYALVATTAWCATPLFGHLKGKSASVVAGAMSAGAALFVFILLTVETAAYYHRLRDVASGAEGVGLAFDCWITLGVVWSIYGALLVTTGIRRSAHALYAAGLLALLTGIAAAALRGASFEPITGFTFLFNWRAGGMLAVAAAGFTVVRLLNRGNAGLPWRKEIVAPLRLALVILLLILVTAETRDYFEKGIALTGEKGREARAEVLRLENLEQLSLSGVWLFSSIVLMGLGIWRRSRSLRIASIVLFGFTILKIFIYDLSFLDTLYRIFSFIGLGVILLGVSYTYQRYKGLIFGPGPPAR